MQTCHISLAWLYVTLAFPLQGGEENDHFILWFLGILSYQGPIIQSEQLSRTCITAFSPTSLILEQFGANLEYVLRAVSQTNQQNLKIV